MTVAAILVAADPPAAGTPPPALFTLDDGSLLIEYVIREIREAGVRDIEVVLGHEAGRIIPYVTGDNVEPIVNGDWRSGFSSSLRVGATAVPRGTTVALIMRVDEPRPAALLAMLLDAHAAAHAPLTRPTFDGTPGAPIVIDESVLGVLRNVADDAAFHALIARYGSQTANVPVHTDLVLARVGSAEDYRRLRETLDG